MASLNIAQLSHSILNAQHALGEAFRGKTTTLEEAQLYIGLNDRETREQKLETDRYVAIMKRVCRYYGVPFSFSIVEGGYIHDDGEYTEEKTIVLTFVNVPQETVEEIAKEMCVFFHQESVLIATDRIHVRSVRETI